MATLDRSTSTLIATRMLEFNRRKRFPLTLYRSLVTTADIVIVFFFLSSLLIYCFIILHTYSRVHFSSDKAFFKSAEINDTSYDIFFEKPNNQKTKQNVNLQLRQFSIFFAKISGIGPWVSWKIGA